MLTHTPVFRVLFRHLFFSFAPNPEQFHLYPRANACKALGPSVSFVPRVVSTRSIENSRPVSQPGGTECSHYLDMI